MSIDKKSQHVGNHGGVYTDNDGQTKQFTYIDHDKKTTISAAVSKKEDFTSFFKQYREELIERIIHVPAVYCPMEYQDFTNSRGENVTTITWNTQMLSDEGLQISRLRGLAVMLENKADHMRITI